MVLDIKRDIKDFKRFRKILVVLFEEGLGHYLKKGDLRSHLKFLHRLQPTRPLSKKENQAIALRHAFERLGPTFVKFGQLLSLRPDLVPVEYCHEFEKLQDHVPSFDFKEVKKTIQEDLGSPINQIFKSFKKVPVASASMAQVHEAVLKSGKKVAVKVQRPNLQEIIDGDLDILFFIAHYLEKHFVKTKKYRPVAIVKEFALWTRRELDFEIEAENAKRLKKELKNNKHVYVPKIYTHFSSSHVLTMEFVSGTKLDDLTQLRKLKINCKSLAMNYFLSILEQALIYGFFHADPHPGNIFVKKDCTLVYLDYGIMGELSTKDRNKVLDFVRSIPQGDPDHSLDIMISLARDTTNANLKEFKNKALPILKKAFHNSIGEGNLGRGFYQIISLGANYGVIFDPAHVLLAKAIYQAEGMCGVLDPKFKVADGMRRFADIYLKANYSPKKMVKRLKTTLLEHKELLFNLPDHVLRILKRLESAPQQDTKALEYLEHMEERREHNTRKRNEVLLIVTLFLLALFLFYLEGRTNIFGIPLSVIVLIFAGFMGLFFIHSNKKEVQN